MTTPHQILVASGAQQAITLVVSTTVGPGDVVLGEEDTWPGLIDAVRQTGARFEQILMDGEGLIVGDLEAKMDRLRPSLLVLNPQHQNPTGSRLPIDRVEAVATLAKNHRVPVLDDRVSADLGFDRRHLPAIDEFDTGGYGITVGSIDKIAWHGLRLGWVRADAQVINRLRSPKAVADMNTSAISQMLALGIVDRYEEFVEARVSALAPSANFVVDTIQNDLPEWTFSPVRGGLSVWARLPDNISATAFVQHAGRHGVLLASGRQFCAADVDCPDVRIPFTSDFDDLKEGLRRTVEAWGTFDRLPVAASVI